MLGPLHEVNTCNYIGKYINEKILPQKKRYKVKIELIMEELDE